MHLQAIACGLDQAFIRRLTNPWPAMILLGTLGLLWTRWVNRPLVSVFGLMGIASGVVAGTVWVGAAYSWLLPITGGLLTLGSGWAVAQSHDLVTERMEKRRLRREFRRFVSHDVADALVEQPDQWRQSSTGVKRRVLVLFADVRGFTARAELADPADLVKQLNQYLTVMVEVVFRHGGTLDKFIGDAIMAHWGALGGGNDQDNARRSISAARDMLAALEILNSKWQAENKTPFRIGVGLHLGDVIAGEIGSPDRTEFGVIGDAVNLASRLEGLTKAFGCDVVLSSEVREAAGIADRFIALGTVRVAGRRMPCELFAIGDEARVREHLTHFVRDATGVLVMPGK